MPGRGGAHHPFLARTRGIPRSRDSRVWPNASRESWHSGVPGSDSDLPTVIYTLIPPAGFFFFNDTATTEIYTLTLHDALRPGSRTRAGDPEGRRPSPRPGQLNLRLIRQRSDTASADVPGGRAAWASRVRQDRRPRRRGFVKTPMANVSPGVEPGHARHPVPGDRCRVLRARNSAREGVRVARRAGRRRTRQRARPAVSAGDVIGLALAVAALAYLVWALLFPERL